MLVDKGFNLNLPWKKKINFAFFSDEKLIIDKIENHLDDIQYIDSDIDTRTCIIGVAKFPVASSFKF